jgi:GMP synthase (glutamine-hydrolysing)
MPPRILVVDAYPREGRQRLADAGGTPAGDLYQHMLERIEPRLEIEICYPADGEAPENRELPDYAGAAWTGSNLSILKPDDPPVARQLDLARGLLASGLPCFGSCFAIQLATVALGGRCGASPRGREFGIARKIRLSREGLTHPLYRAKPEIFDAFTSHADEVVDLPAATRLLASNSWSNVQGASMGPFWAVQYHPEYDLHEVASLCRLRKRELIAQGMFANDAEAQRYSETLEALHRDPSRKDLAESLEVGESLLSEETRTLEIRNWVEAQVMQ